MGWDGFQRSMEIVAKLKKDPSPLVRRAALHVFQDAFEMESGGLPTTPQAITNEMTARKRRMRWRPEEGDEPEAPAPGKKQGPRRRARTPRAGQRQ
jgi:hypothetical protein